MQDHSVALLAHRHVPSACGGTTTLFHAYSVTGTTTTVSPFSGYDSNGKTITQTQQSVDAANPALVQTHTSAVAYDAADWETSTPTMG